MGYPTRALLLCGLLFALSQAGCESETEDSLTGATSDASTDAIVSVDAGAVDTAAADTALPEDAGAPAGPDTTVVVVDATGSDSGSGAVIDAGTADIVEGEDGMGPGLSEDAGGGPAKDSACIDVCTCARDQR